MRFRTFSRCLLSCVISTALAKKAYTQERVLTGTVKNEVAEPLPAASVNLVNERSVIYSFAITNKEGYYTLTVPSSPGSPAFWLEVSYIGYKKQRVIVNPDRSAYNITLIADTGMLRGVTVQNRPVIQSLGDTIRYNVNSFARKEDRTIGDVLRRMPGITVDEDGTIYYNGKMVENLYIHGDDLMDGRYGLAPKAIRKDLVSDVDVIRNHQPLRVLKDKEFSDKTTINLVLKDAKSLKLSAKGMAGAGLPEQYDISFTPLLLNERIKTLNTLAINNSGVDYRNDFKQLGSSNLVTSIAEDAQVVDLSLGTNGGPDLQLEDYYINRSGIINLNSLYKTKKAVQLKANFQFFYDKNRFNYYSQADNFLPADTVTYKETQQYTNQPQLLNGSFSILMNRDRYFFNNSLKVNLSRNTDNSRMIFNDNAFTQQLRRTIREFSNDLSWIPALKGKSVGELRWLISYTSNNQSLDIGKGYYADISGHQDYHDNVRQQVKVPTLYSHTYISWRKPGKLISQQYKTGLIIQSQTLESSLSFEKNSAVTTYSGDAGNNLQWDRRSIYLSEEYQLRHKKLRASLQLPLAYQHIIYREQEYSLHQTKKDIIFTPAFTIRYEFTNEQSLSAKYNHSNTFGNITNIYPGAILQTYRVLQNNEAALQERSMHTAGINYEYQKTVSMLFMNTGINWSRMEQNTILSTDVTDNIQRIIQLPYKNSIISTGVNTTFSKYLFDLKTTVSLKSGFNRYRYTRLLNGETLPFYTNTVTLNGNLIKKLFGTMNLTWQPACMWTSSRTGKKGGATTAGFSSRSFRSEQQLAINFILVKRWLIEINGRHTYSTQTGSRKVQYMFTDIKCRYTPPAKKIDLNLDITNLFNIKNYTRYTLQANQQMQDQYTLRGRMVILRVEYLF